MRTLPLLALFAGLAGAPAAHADDAPRAWRDSMAALESARRWAAAETLATSVLARFDRTPRVDSADVAMVLSVFANSRLARAQLRDGAALAAADRAIGIRERIRPRPRALVVRAHVLRGRILTEMARPEPALVSIRLASAEMDTIGAPDDSTRGLIAVLEARAHKVAGDVDASLGAYARGLEFRERRFGHEHAETGGLLSEYGVALVDAGRFDEARAAFVRAVRIGEQLAPTSTENLEGALSNMSTLTRRVGDVAESIELMQRSYDLVRRRLGDEAAGTLRAKANLGMRLILFGDDVASSALLAEAADGLEKRYGEAHPAPLNVRLALVSALVNLGDTASAARQLARADHALAGQPTSGNSNYAFAQLQHSVLDLERGDRRSARAAVERALEAMGAKEDPLGAQLGDVYGQYLKTLRGPEDAALADSFGRAIDSLRARSLVEATPTWLITLGARARAEARVGRRDAAWEHARLAERTALDRLQMNVMSLPDRRALQLSEMLGSPVDLVAHLARDGNDAEVRTAWDRLVRWRGLVRDIVERRRSEAPPGDTAAAAAFARWRAAQRRHAQLVVSGAADPDDPETRERYVASRAEAEDAERAYARHTRRSVGADSVTLAAVLARLAPGEALVGFVATGAETDTATLRAFVAVERGARVRVLDLGEAAPIAAAIQAWKAHLGAPPSARGRSSERDARRWGEIVRAAVWDPVVAAAGGARALVVVGDGPVVDLPWLALPAKGGRYLAEEATAVRVLNAERELLRDAGRGPGHGLLAVGDPAFDRGRGDGAPAPGLMRAARRPCATTTLPALPPLPAARAEASEVARLWRSGDDGATTEVLLGEDATEEAFKREAPGRRVLHLATHGVMVKDGCGAPATDLRGVGGLGLLRPLPPPARRRAPAAPAEPARPPSPWLAQQVWLALAGAGRPPAESTDENEGLLTAEEVVTLDLRGVDWVVLSACQSGLAERWTREGLLGMRRAFHVAGARAVIASQWPVADESTREWMAALYAARTGSRAGASAAVQAACREVLAARRRSGRSTHPFAWAGFTPTGD